VLDPRPPGPRPAARTVHAAGVAEPQLHGAPGARSKPRARADPQLRSRWLRLVTAAWLRHEKPPGSDSGVGRMTRPGGEGPGEESLCALATPGLWGTCAPAAPSGRVPFWGAASWSRSGARGPGEGAGPGPRPSGTRALASSSSRDRVGAPQDGAGGGHMGAGKAEGVCGSGSFLPLFLSSSPLPGSSLNRGLICGGHSQVTRYTVSAQ
jgi:hypothetical protein